MEDLIQFIRILSDKYFPGLKVNDDVIMERLESVGEEIMEEYDSLDHDSD